MQTPKRGNIAPRLWLGLIFAVGFACAESTALCQSNLYTEGPGTNPLFSEIRNSIANGYAGTTIDVNNELVEGGLFIDYGVQSDLKIHTLGSSVVGENAHDNWTRWYQTDGATQVFRLFPGEENVRNDRPLAARIEAFDANTGWNIDDGEWNEWVARYTIVKPIDAAIFQAKDQDHEAWSVHLNMTASGNVYVQHRRPLPGQEKRELLVQDAIGKPFDVRIRDNGLDYEVYLDDRSEPFTTGRYVRNAVDGDNSNTRFRWGIYVGAKEVESEAIIFVSHATVNPELDFPTDPDDPTTDPLVAGWDTWSEVSADTWNATQTSGVSARAVGSPEAGGVFFNFSNPSVSNGASSDGQYGSVGPASASTSVAAPSDGVTLSNGFDGSIDFVLTDTTGAKRNLTGFHFDIGAFRPDAATDWQLEVLVGGALTAGPLATGSATVIAGPMADDESVDLTGLADSTLDANGSVTFRLSFTGGGGDPGSVASGHHLFLDNVGVTALVEAAAGDFDGSGSIDAADYALWASAYGSEEDLRADGNGDGVVDAADYSVWRDAFANASAAIHTDKAFSQATHGIWPLNHSMPSQDAPVSAPEPSAFVIVVGVFMAGVQSKTRTLRSVSAPTHPARETCRGATSTPRSSLSDLVRKPIR